MNRIPIADPTLSARAIERASTLMERGSLADGPEVRRFESEFAAYCDVDHAVATANGTTALHAALHGLGLEPGGRIVTSPLSFVATANAVRLAGGRPSFVDIDRETYTVDPTALERHLSRTDVAGVLPVHLYGLPAAMDEIGDIAASHDAFVLADACQAHGAALSGDTVGGLGDAACFSFYPTKNMTTLEGGMVTTDRRVVADRVRSFVNHGRPPGRPGEYAHDSVGHNFRMTSVAAAVGRVQLERLAERNRSRRRTAAAYDEALASLPVTTPVEPADRRHVYHQYTIRTPARESVRSFLADEGVETGVYYPTPLHRLPPHRTSARLERAERAAETVLSLPVHPGLTAADRRTVADSLTAYFDTP